MRVLIFSQYYPPEVGATQTRVNTFARELVKRGHHVTVVSEIPNHPAGVYFEGWRKRWYTRTVEDGIDVIRVFVVASPKKTFPRRLAFYLSYMLNAIVIGLLLARRPDVVLASSPPLFVGVAGMFVAAAKGVPFVLDVRDLWPAAAVSLGELREGRAHAIAERVERMLYDRALAITCVTQAFMKYIQNLGVEASKLHHLPNGTLPEVFVPLPADPGLADDLNLDRTFVAGFLGNHGVAQGLDVLLDAAAQTGDEVMFLFVGEGPVKAALQNRANREGITNVRFAAQVPPSEVIAYIALCDVLLVPLQPDDVFTMFVPSKMFDFWACGKPVLLMAGGEAADIVRRSGAGVVIEPGDANQLSRTLAAMRKEPEGTRAMGVAGRAFVLANYDRNAQAGALERLLVQAARPGTVS